MSKALHRVLVIGFGLGPTRQIAELFPEPGQAKKPTELDTRRLAEAEAKRLRRAEKRRPH